MGVRILEGDCRDVLATLPADSVQCVVTSPPYYGLRDYGVAGQIGLEATPDAYLATMVEVFREVRRVLRPDGTCWVNMGDSYAHTGAAGGSVFDNGRNDGRAAYEADKARGREERRSTLSAGLKPKDLLMMPARLALALQADGWWIRSDIIWHKPNPMPESVTDRPTSAHEHVFLLTRSSRYYYDNEAIREPQTEPGRVQQHAGGKRWDAERFEDRRDHDNAGSAYNPAGRSCRNVWTLATHSFPGAHFATFPPALAERCIKAGTSERGCCAACGKPWVRVTEQALHCPASGGTMNQKGPRFNLPRVVETTTTGWQPSCDHNAEVVPCTVLDPFAGAGTTLLVADRLQRDAIGIELSPGYTEMAMERCRADAPLFTALPPAEPPEDVRMADLFAWAAD